MLSDTQPRGKSKAVFFKLLGFDATRAESLADELFRHAAENEVEHLMETEFGDRYVVGGWIVSPERTRARIRTVWFVEVGEETPRFVTAHPLRRADQLCIQREDSRRVMFLPGIPRLTPGACMRPYKP